jgi:L-asparaginase II
MSNPVLVEVLRGGTVESRHSGAIAVVDADGSIVFSAGEFGRPVFPRSSVKAIQALLLVETGAAEEYGFGTKELALSQASHIGQPGHVRLAQSMLKAAGLDDTALECGPQMPAMPEDVFELTRSGTKPSALHNNCSGKHSGFLCVCAKCGIATRGYVKAEHEFQAMIRDVMTDVTGYEHRAEDAGIDGCSIPTYPVPLTNLAHGFAKMATGKGLAPSRAGAARKLLDAAMAEPWLVGGTICWNTKAMTKAAGRVFAKDGAEGMFCAAIPEMGIGIALKCDDGAPRGAEAMISAVLGRVLPKGDPLAEEFSAMAHLPITNRNGWTVGEIRPVETVR